ncbi:hypothetical protein E8E12_005886 [Didymella heteroderae]|uniref:Uncharacterized protein n=1 Tax=Didymella heteroderae TaxID=1769908 RepID=A0A9P4WK65_9PLEO|nr:hypothetical protein E8E12_005886 [Didymella heteroderae]
MVTAFPGKTHDIKVCLLEPAQKPELTPVRRLDMGSAQDEFVENNPWIPEQNFTGFCSFMQSFYEEAFKPEMQLRCAIVIALNNNSEEHLNSRHNRAEKKFRLLYCPAILSPELADGFAIRVAEHTDFGTIKMLFEDSDGGLQAEIRTSPGVFRRIKLARLTDIIFIIGDSFQRLTTDTFRAAYYWVTLPPLVKAGGNVEILERYSIAYFTKPNCRAVLLLLKETYYRCETSQV